jgi:transcriptional regulator with XRE-family HTH domain
MNVEVRMSTVRELREGQKLSQMELAIKAQVSIPVISRMENGHVVSRNSFERVCKELGVDPAIVEGVNVKRTFRRG